MKFKDIIGHQLIKKKLIQTVKDQRVSHAQLFMGPEGNGKLALAIAYAQYLNCQDKKEDDSCGHCPSCLKFEKLAHPDLHFMFPVATNKDITKNPVSAHFIDDWRTFLHENNYYVDLNDWYEKIGIEKKQGIINVHDCNNLLKTLSYTTYEAEYKVMVIWMVEKMNYSAAPKILKILEEPPDKTLFILVTENVDQILSTIISRTQIVKIPKINDEDMILHLQKIENISTNEAQKFTSLGEGNYIEIRRLLNGGENSSNFAFFQDWMRACWAINFQKIKESTDHFAGMGRERQKLFLSFSLKIIRDCLLSHYKNDRVLILEGEEKIFLQKFSPFLHRGNGAGFMEKLNSAYNHIERNANPSILFFNLSLKFINLLKIPKPVDN